MSDGIDVQISLAVESSVDSVNNIDAINVSFFNLIQIA